MPGVTTYETDLKMLQAGVLDLGALQLRLFVNDVIPSKGDPVSAFQEAAGFGYASLALAPNLWAFDVGPPAAARYPAQSWKFTGALGNVYGYYLVDASGVLRGGERFTGAPFEILRNGDIIRVTPEIGPPL